MDNFDFTIVPGTVRAFTNRGKETRSRLHVHICYKDGKLSITGCYLNGGGQCYDMLTDESFEPAEGWTHDKAATLQKVWKRWHLNNLRPYCEHQRDLGWPSDADKTLTWYRWALKHDTCAEQGAIKRAMLETVKSGVPFHPTKRDIEILNLEAFTVTFSPSLGKGAARYYEPISGVGVYRHVNTNRLGNTYHSSYEGFSPVKHDSGLLCKPCPVCGYKYGAQWKTEEVPADVLDWLRGLKK